MLSWMHLLACEFSRLWNPQFMLSALRKHTDLKEKKKPTHPIPPLGLQIPNSCSVLKESIQIWRRKKKNPHNQSLPSDYKILKILDFDQHPKPNPLKASEWINTYTDNNNKKKNPFSFHRTVTAQTFHYNQHRFTTSKHYLRKKREREMQIQCNRSTSNYLISQEREREKEICLCLLFDEPQMQQICLDCKQPKQEEEEEEINTEKRGMMTRYEVKDLIIKSLNPIKKW